MAGYVQLDRKIMKWEWYDDANTFRLFVHLLLTCNHKAAKWHGKTVLRGQVITGRMKLAAVLGLTEMQIRTSLNKLKSTGEITIKVTNQNSLITICKYNTYQSKEIEDNQPDNQQSNQRITNEQPTDNQRVTTNNNDNNVNNDRVNGNTPPVIDISKSNLFRQPTIPTKQQVWECFSTRGGTKEMAKTFYDNNEGTGWFYKGSPITNFQNLVPAFIANWKKFDDKNKPADSTNVKIILK